MRFRGRWYVAEWDVCTFSIHLSTYSGYFAFFLQDFAHGRISLRVCTFSGDCVVVLFSGRDTNILSCNSNRTAFIVVDNTSRWSCAL